jgi:metal-sulfur cluster biosynthetic enzyme
LFFHPFLLDINRGSKTVHREIFFFKMTELVNPEPKVFTTGGSRTRAEEELLQERDDDVADPIDALEVYDLIKNIMDPEHPNTLEELRVVNADDIIVDEVHTRTVHVQFTPTVPHCSMTTLIGLCIRVKLERCLSKSLKVKVSVAPGTHYQEAQVNKQLADKERVAAALESRNLMDLVSRCINEYD